MCCDACLGWFHLKCMGMKVGAEVMKGEEFVCPFCVSSIMLSIEGGDYWAEEGVKGCQE